jgi:p-aminobenzoyl-glutamate transporter AbgT
MAGVLGPILVNYIREYQLEHGVARADAYTITMYILAGLLVLGFVCNWLVQSVAEQHYMTDEELAEEKKQANDTHQHFVEDVEALAEEASHSGKVLLAWLAVWIPLGWGIWMTVQKAVLLFK